MTSAFPAGKWYTSLFRVLLELVSEIRILTLSSAQKSRWHPNFIRFQIGSGRNSSWKSCRFLPFNLIFFQICKGVSYLKICMGYFALPWRNCENFSNLSKPFKLTALTSQFWFPNVKQFGQENNFFLEAQNDLYTFLNLRQLWTKCHFYSSNNWSCWRWEFTLQHCLWS